MKAKKVMKIVVALLVAIMLVTAFTQVVSAANVDLGQFSNNEKDNSGASNAVTNIIGSVIYIARIIGATTYTIFFSTLGQQILLLSIINLEYL